MFDINLLNGEEIIFTDENVLITKNNKNSKYSIVITNKRLMFFDKLTDSMESLMISQAMGTISTLFLKEEFKLTDILSIDFDTDKDKYVLKDNSIFYLYDEDIKLEIKNQLKQL